MDPDDAAYRKSVRNMSVVLAAIVITVFAAIFIPPYLNPPRETFETSVTQESAFGFTMHLTINATSVASGGGITLSGWLNSTAALVENVTAADSWALPQGLLWGRTCTAGWPVGLGIMRGHYTQDNVSSGTLVRLPAPIMYCPAVLGSPQYFLFEPAPHSSKALVTIGSSPAIWMIQSSLGFSRDASGGGLQPGVYTAVLADEWGDVLTTNFRVT